MTNIELIREVKRNAVNHWSGILPACGVDVPERGKHGACPVCGGTDRFHFIDDHHNGNWFCRQCDEPNHGDGLDLIAKVKGISIYEAAKEVSQVLSLPLPEPARKEAPKSESQPIAEKVQKLVAQTTVGKSAYLTQKGTIAP
ncbi:plasmid-like protein [Proteus mirabilis]|uniref:Plasmid-like protein n=1 Tax=Proteus mirabilis TaxID=584 RepID=A0A379FK42_PROMI|nr:plasmid-like protein [Proteus mirabilis]